MFNKLAEMKVYEKLFAVIRTTLTNAKSKVKFQVCFYDPFEIKTRVRQGDGLSPLSFNCVLEKVVKEWCKVLKKETCLNH